MSRINLPALSSFHPFPCHARLFWTPSPVPIPGLLFFFFFSPRIDFKTRVTIYPINCKLIYNLLQNRFIRSINFLIHWYYSYYDNNRDTIEYEELQISRTKKEEHWLNLTFEERKRVTSFVEKKKRKREGWSIFIERIIIPLHPFREGGEMYPLYSDFCGSCTSDKLPSKTSGRKRNKTIDTRWCINASTFHTAKGVPPSCRSLSLTN